MPAQSEFQRRLHALPRCALAESAVPLVGREHTLETPRIGAPWATGLQQRGQTPIQRLRRACRRRQISAREKWGDFAVAGVWSARLRGGGLFCERRFF